MNTRKPLLKIAGIVLAAGLPCAGCDNGHWVDASLMLTGAICDYKTTVQNWTKPTQLMGVSMKTGTEDDLKEFMLTEERAICSKSGGAFTGDTRCENGGGQVKCK